MNSRLLSSLVLKRLQIVCYINRRKREKRTRMSKKICSPLADLLNKTVIQIKMRNERCGEKNTQLKAVVILHPDTVVRGDAVMSDSYHYHRNNTEEILVGLQKQQTRCLKDCSDSLQQPLPIKHKITLISKFRKAIPLGMALTSLCLRSLW